MLDLTTNISKAVAALPDIPSAILPANMCDKAFMIPIGAAHYAIKVPPGEKANVCISALPHALFT